MLPLHNLCRIELRGWFDLNWAAYVGTMLVRKQLAQGAIRSTTLVGPMRDLEAFLGLLHMLIDRGFPVQSFEYRQAESGETEAGDGLLHDSTDATPRSEAE